MRSSAGKITSFYVLTGIYAVFTLFTLVAFRKTEVTAFYAIMLTCFLCAAVNLRGNRLTLLYYINILALAVFMFSLQTHLGTFYLIFRQLSDHIPAKAAFLFILHIVAVTAGGALIAQRPGPGPGSESGTGARRVTLSTAVIATTVMLVLIAGCVTVLGASTFTETRFERLQIEEENPLNRVLEFFAKSVLYTLSALLILSHSGRGRAVVFRALIVFLAVLAITLSNPTNTARFISLSGTFIILLALLFRLGLQRWIRTFILLVPLILVLALPVTSVLRYGSDYASLEVAAEMFQGLEFSWFQVYLDSVAYIADKDLFSLHTLTAIFQMIPRAIWSSKEGVISHDMAVARGYVIDNVSLPSFFNFYADYGYLGLVLCSLVLGWLLVRIDISGARRLDIFSRRQMYGLLVLSLVPIIARGSAGTACTALYAFIASYEVLRLLLRLTIRPAVDPQSFPRPPRASPGSHPVGSRIVR